MTASTTDLPTSTTATTDIDQPGGVRGHIAQKAGNAIDAVARATGRADDPRVAQAKQFASKKPLAIAAAAGVIGFALLNTLRGRR